MGFFEKCSSRHSRHSRRFFESLLEAYPGPLSVYKVEPFVTVPIFAKSSITNFGRGPGSSSAFFWE